MTLENLHGQRQISLFPIEKSQVWVSATKPESMLKALVISNFTMKTRPILELGYCFIIEAFSFHQFMEQISAQVPYTHIQKKKKKEHIDFVSSSFLWLTL